MTNQFNPSFTLKNRHIQTLYSSFFKKVEPHKFDIQRFELSDGDAIECYWYSKQDIDPAKPIVMFFHGLAGSYKSPYIQGTMRELYEEGFNSVVVHFRGCSGVMNSQPISYHSGKTDDALEFVKSTNKRYTDAKLFAIGYSLGGNMLLKLLGELGYASPFTSAIAVSAPMQLELCGGSMDSGFSKIYQAHLMKSLNSSLEKKCDMYDMKKLIGLDKKDIKNLRTFLEFDDAYTAPVHGFASAKDYYEKSSSKQYLRDITTSTLIIHAKDDPFMTPAVIPTKDELSSTIELEVYENGGHVGFIDGSIFKPKYWLEKKVVEYFKQFV